MATIFTKIIKGEIPCYKIAESERFFAFLDISPLTMGHTLVVPKNEIDYFFDIEDSELADMMAFAKKVSLSIRKIVPCKRIGVAVIGLEVPHAHIHLVPLNGGNDLNFSNPKLKFSKEEFEELAEKIRENF